MKYAGTIFNNKTGERIPFATIVFRPSLLTIAADNKGYFEKEFTTPQNEISLSAAEMQPVRTSLYPEKTIFFMDGKEIYLQGVTVKTKPKPKPQKLPPVVVKKKSDFLLISAAALLLILLLKK